MRKLMTVCVIALMAVDVFGFATFDTDNEGSVESRVGQKVVNSTTQMGVRGGYESWYWPPTAADWAPSGGSGGGVNNGYIYQDITTDATQRGYGLYYKQANFLGDLSQPTNNTVKVDLKLDGDLLGNFSQLATGDPYNYGSPSNGYRSFTADGTPLKVMARLTIDRMANNWNEYDMFISKSAFSIDLNAIQNNGWTTFSFEMISDNFIRWPNSQTNTVSFDQIISDYSSIGFAILAEGDDMSRYGSSGDTAWAWDDVAKYYRLTDYGAYSEGTSQFGVDNFQAVPEPATLAILGLGALFLRKRKA